MNPRTTTALAWTLAAIGGAAALWQAASLDAGWLLPLVSGAATAVMLRDLVARLAHRRSANSHGQFRCTAPDCHFAISLAGVTEEEKTRWEQLAAAHTHSR